ncbi:MAG: OmpA family protein [Pseudomonadota bacterium]
MFNFSRIFCPILISLFMAASAGAQDSLRASLFDDARDALIAANQANAPYLAPTSYEAGAEHYKKAEELLERGGNLDRIRSELDKALKDWQTALAAANTARTTLSNAVLARDDAKNAAAPEVANKEWRDAEDLFRDATTRLESGSNKSALRLGGKAETAYRAAELTAIKANYLNETKALLEQADDLRADRYAPATFESAGALLTEAESELNDNRYDTDRPRSLAQSAKHQAKLAIHLTGQLRDAEKDRAALEALALDWQTPVKRIGATLDIPVYFDDGYEDATDTLVARVEELLEQNRAQSQDLAERKSQIREMESQIATLEERLGGASQERLALAAQLDRQARRRAKFEAVEKQFTRDEAIVLRAGNDVILRLVGLTFASGKSEIGPDKFALLAKVRDAINQFDNADIVVEGHTDAFGSDDSNMALSTERAEAVRAYMLANMGLSDTQVTASGYGETQPIANNETPEGRTKNRRIDIILRPAN